ncbi:hypothetical protein TRFO_38122 [Tritrichomonas foetus]|uniref:FYVE-type domain-containing protein n=1 Tax=Tritrichomonas foetus TaxID=1144522 RepID=A0A1J4JDL2_9EUKA|nr:hypothetical protein TRFO_38122 [Tritrichomonas foetus]|eukprot:OHS95763.1 hypothetical protein TRFO_38122 [Tritrichomonas foetus]
MNPVSEEGSKNRRPTTNSRTDIADTNFNFSKEPPFPLLINPKSFIAAQFLGINADEANFVDLLESNSEVNSKIVDFVGYEREFIRKSRCLQTVLQKVTGTIFAVLPQALFPSLIALTDAHVEFLSKLEELIKNGKEDLVQNFIFLLTNKINENPENNKLNASHYSSLNRSQSVFRSNSLNSNSHPLLNDSNNNTNSSENFMNNSNLSNSRNKTINIVQSDESFQDNQENKSNTPKSTLEKSEKEFDIRKILEIHQNYSIQLLKVENLANSFSVECKSEIAEELGEDVVIRAFRLPFLWQDYSLNLVNCLLNVDSIKNDSKLNDLLTNFMKVIENLSDSVDSIPFLENISRQFLREPFPIVITGRRFICQGKAFKQCRKTLAERVLFLFSDIFIYAQRKGGKLLVPRAYLLCKLRVEAHNYNDQPSLYIYAPIKSFILQFHTFKDRDYWKGTLKDAISNAQGYQIIPRYREAPIWVPDSVSNNCMNCNVQLSFFNRKHHCRCCGKIMCSECLQNKFVIPTISNKPVKICSKCLEVLKKEAEETEKRRSLNPKVQEKDINEDEEEENMNLILSTNGTLQPGDNDSSDSSGSA